MIRLLYFMMGFVGLGGQLLILRRFLVTFSGNEMTVGVVLAAWTAWTGIGSWIGGRFSGKWSAEKAVTILFALLFSLLPVTYCAVYLAKLIIGVGLTEAVGPFKMAGMSFAVIAPVCLVLGALFPVLCHRLSGQAVAGQQSAVGATRESPLQEPGIAVGRVYLWEALGAGAGGVLSSAVLITFFRPLAAVFALCAIGAATLAAASKNRLRAVWIIAAVLAIVGATTDAPDDWLRSRRWAGYPVIAESDSRYAHLALVASLGESTLFVDGLPSITWPGAAPAEELAHLPMLAHPNPKRVLLIGGGLSTVGAEILKYPIEWLDYSELDPAIIEMERRVSSGLFTDPRVKVHPVDGRRFIGDAPAGYYDVIIIAAGDPQSLASNRYFSREMFRMARRALTTPGVIGFATGEYANYIDPLQARYLALIRATLGAEFDNVSIYPLGRFYFLGGTGVSLPKNAEDISAALSKKATATRWFRPEVFIPNLSAERVASMQNAVDSVPNPGINGDFHPLGYALWTAYWSTLFSDGERDAVRRIFKVGPTVAVLVLGFLLVVGIFIVRRGRPPCLPNLQGQLRGVAPTAIVAAMGFAEMVLTVSVLYSAQVRLGMLFSLMGYLITALMVGLSIGAYAMNRVPAKSLRTVFISLSGSLIAILIAMIPLLSRALMMVGDGVAIILLTAIALTGSAVSGAIYAGAARIGQGCDYNNTGRLGGNINMADLLGSAAGALLAGTIMLPLWGFSVTLAFTAAVMAAGMIVWSAARKLPVPPLD